MISDETLLSVAIAYYMQHKTQVEIAKDLHVSHVQIGKYLKEAMRRGIVSIQVNLPIAKEEEESLKTIFKTLFSLKNLVLTQGSENSDKSHRHVVAKATAYLLENYPDIETRIGLGWGRTMRDIALSPNPMGKKENWIYSPLCMLSSPVVDNPYYDSATMVRTMARNWGGKANESLVDMMEMMRHGHSDKLMKQCRTQWQKNSMLICGMGCATSRYPLPRKAMFPEGRFEEINTKSLVGDILHNFYDVEGHLFPAAGYDVMIPLEDIRQTPLVVAVASGFSKVESIIGGLRTGLVDTLVTDVQTAHHVIEYLK